MGITAEEIMTEDVTTVTEGTSLATALEIMQEKRIRHLPVVRDRRLVGMLSDPLSLATQRLDLSNKHGLIVVEDGWPVGIFAQVDALAARARDPRTHVEEVMSLKVLVLPPSIPLHRAAGQALAMGVRRILLVDERLEGVVSTFDFAGVVR